MWPAMEFLPKSRKARRRLAVIAAAAPVLIAAVGLSLYAARNSVVFFYSPAQALADHVPAGRIVRLGGLVKTGTVDKRPDGAILFKVTDNRADDEVIYKGDLPDLFREGQGVVAEGAFDSAGVFQATQVLAKHDERYMPKEVADAIKARGEWRSSGPSAQ
jgi:cytochrome c-type biogenesis protein CcmE